MVGTNQSRKRRDKTLRKKTTVLKTDRGVYLEKRQGGEEDHTTIK